MTGRKPRQVLTAEQVADIVQLVRAGANRDDVAARFGVSRSSVDKFMRNARRADEAGKGLPKRSPVGDPHWRERAACGGLWDTDRNGRLRYFTDWSVPEQIAVCETCDVRSPCLEDGLKDPSAAERKTSEGRVYGGVGPRGLDALRRDMRVSS